MRQRSIRVTHEMLLSLMEELSEDYLPWGSDDRQRPEWGADCSSGCRFAWWLRGDWCICLNHESHRAGMLTYEHQGCRRAERGPAPRWDDGAQKAGEG